MFGFECVGNQTLLMGLSEIPAKIYSTMVHHLKYKTNVDWSFSKNTTYKALRRKLTTI